jgi:hypothetical protein
MSAPALRQRPALVDSPPCFRCGNETTISLGRDAAGDDGADLFECSSCGTEIREVIE